ncbi:MAG: Gfo/Idh/MocA family oxidoreductase [Planctomycetota bacterium]
MPTLNRRHCLKQSLFASLAVASGVHSSSAASPVLNNANEALGVGCIGLRYQGSVIAHKAAMYGSIVAVCDVDKNVRDPVKAAFGSTPRDYEDYRDLLQDPRVDVVTIGTPDHWHTKMILDAARAGKDIYCEKPLTLTIDEGIQLRRLLAEEELTPIIQVGSWQRSDARFRQAIEMVRAGRIGRLQQVDVVLGKNQVGGPFEIRKPHPQFNWDLWQGQTPDVPYLAERSHYTFRWWHEYSGGQMTDWGAHHLDIAQWAIDSFPIEIEATATYPEPEQASQCFNVPVAFAVRYRYANDVVMTVSDTGRNGIMFTGDRGRLFVNRGTISGKPVEDLSTNPLLREDFVTYDFDNLDRPERAGKLEAIVNHMGNFFDCIQSRKQPISDLESQHRSVTTCHLGNIAMRVGKTLSWDPQQERFGNSDEANWLLSRPQRAGFEIA